MVEWAVCVRNDAGETGCLVAEDRAEFGEWASRGGVAGVTAANSGLCLLDTDGEVECRYPYEQVVFPFVSTGPWRQAFPANGVCGVRRDGTLECRDYDGDIAGAPPGGDDWSVVHVQEQTRCALGESGFHCWGSATLDDPDQRGVDIAASAWGVACWRYAQSGVLACDRLSEGVSDLEVGGRDAPPREGLTALGLGRWQGCIGASEDDAIVCWGDAGAAPSAPVGREETGYDAWWLP